MNDKSNASSAGSASRGLPKSIVNYSQRAMGWALLAPGEAVQWASSLSRSTLAWGSVALAAILFLSLNLAAALTVRNVKADFTEDHLYSISDGTRKVLSRLEEPITVRVYYSRRLGEVSSVLGRNFDRLKGLLDQYNDISGGKLQVTYIDPEPFSDAEDRAAAAGLKGQRINQDGETGYFGLVASNLTDNDAVVPFFAPERERFLEYDLTKLINGLSNPKKKVVGLISGVPLDGGMNPMNPRAQPTQPWIIMEQIRDFFEVRTLEANVKEIPKDVDVLMLVQPMVLTKDAAYAIDQYALGGGRILAFVDPSTDSAQSGPPGMSLPVSSDLRNIMKQWGVTFDTDKVVGDPAMARRVQFGGGPGGQPIITDYLAWLQIDKAQINDKDPLASSIKRLNLGTAGSLTKVEGATTIIQPLIETTARSGLIDADMVKMRPDPLAILRSFKSGGKPLMLAARIGGEAKSAYPDGRPKDEEKKDETKAPDKTEASEAKPTADAAKADAPADASKAAEAKAAAPKTADGKSHIAAGRVSVVVVADADMLADHFWVEVRDFLGQQMAIPQADNAGFVVNALENLSGGEALADLRGRGIVERPFDRVQAIRRDAEQRYRQTEEGLVAKLQDLQQKLARVETKGGEGQSQATLILSDAEKAEIEKFRSEMIQVRRELRDVKAALRRDIDWLDSWLKFLNIAAVPLLIGIGGLGVGLMRRRSNRNSA